MIIGKFQTKEDGRIVGELQALLIGRVNLTFTPKEKGANYTVTFSETGIEAGAAWKKTSKEGGKPFNSVQTRLSGTVQTVQRRDVPRPRPARHLRSGLGSPGTRGGNDRLIHQGPPRAAPFFFITNKGVSP